MFLFLTITLCRASLLAMLAFLFVSVADANDENALDAEMRSCTMLASDDARLACFDQLANDVLHANELPAESTEPDPADMTAPGPFLVPAHDQAADAKPLTVEVGRESARLDGPVVQPEYAATVTSCDRNTLGRYYFYFANGQVWKQTNSGRLGFRKCEFEVTISKDFFGYKMLVAGERRRIRISRIK